MTQIELDQLLDGKTNGTDPRKWDRVVMVQCVGSRCQACGDCILATTGGICPIARCSKRMSNGPCGGSANGKCEVSKETACGWHLIYERLKELGQLDRFEKPNEPKNWSTSRDGGPRKIIKEVSQI